MTGERNEPKHHYALIGRITVHWAILETSLDLVLIHGSKVDPSILRRVPGQIDQKIDRLGKIYSHKALRPLLPSFLENTKEIAKLAKKRAILVHGMAEDRLANEVNFRKLGRLLDQSDQVYETFTVRDLKKLDSEIVVAALGVSILLCLTMLKLDPARADREKMRNTLVEMVSERFLQSVGID